MTSPEHSMPKQSGKKDSIDKATTLRFMMQPLTVPLNEEGVTEICVNAPGEYFVEKNGKWERRENTELTFDKLKHLAQAAAVFGSTTISDTVPVASCVLPDGERAQFVFPPACRTGCISVTIRRPSLSVRSLDDYLAQHFFSEVRRANTLSDADKELLELKKQWEDSDPIKAEQARARFLIRAVELGKNIVIAGETGSGKTTFMKALMQAIPTDDRIITIEDVPELQYGLTRHPNQVNLFYPSEAKEGDPITAASLVRSCLRMKPDRILLAELRGGETFDFLNVCLSGHSGSITSCHAGSCAGVFDYLALKVMQSPAGVHLPHAVIQRLLHLVIDVIVHVHNHKGKRRITEMWYAPSGSKEE